MKIDFSKFVRGNWMANNSADAGRTFDIEAEVQLNNEKTITSLVNGIVKKDGNIVGRFSLQGGVSIPSFTPSVSDAMEAITAYQAVITFVDAVAAEANENPPFNE